MSPVPAKLRFRLPGLGPVEITWFGVLAALMVALDLIWNFSLLAQTPPRDGGELLLIRLFENILDHGAPLVQVGPESYDLYPRSVLFNYLMAGWKALAGRDMGWLRMVPLGFYYLSAFLVFRILGGGLIGLAGMATMLASNLRIHLTVCKPWTFYEALFLAVILLLKRAFVDPEDEPGRLTRERARSLLVWTLALSALFYESAGLAALLVGMLGLVYLGWGIFRQGRLLAAMIFNVCWIVTTSYLLWKLPLFDLQGLGGAHSMFSPEKYPSLLLALWNGEFLRGIVPLLAFGFFKVAPFGLVFALLIAVFLTTFRKGLGREYRYYALAFLMMLCQVVLYFVLMKNRRWDMVESGRYIFQFHAVWILFIWLTVKYLAQRAGEGWRRPVRIGLTLVMGLGIAATMVGEGRLKPFFEHNFHDYAGPVKKLRQGLGPDDRIYLTGEFRTLRSYLKDWPALDLISVGNPPRKDREFRGTGPGGRPFRGEDYYTRTRIIEGLPWLADLVGAVQGGRRVWILQDAWPLRERLEEYSPEQYYLEFQKGLYQLHPFPELTAKAAIDPSGAGLSLPRIPLGGAVLTLEVESFREGQAALWALAEIEDGRPINRKRILLNPGPNRIVLFYHRLPTRLTLEGLGGTPARAAFRSVTVEGLGSGLRTVLRSSLLGRGLDYLLPFESLRSLALGLIKGREGRAALEERRRYPDKAPDTVLIFKVVPPGERKALAGAGKVSLNTAAVHRPELIREASPASGISGDNRCYVRVFRGGPRFSGGSKPGAG